MEGVSAGARQVRFPGQGLQPNPPFVLATQLLWIHPTNLSQNLTKIKGQSYVVVNDTIISHRRIHYVMQWIQLDVYICPLLFRFPSHLGHHRALSSSLCYMVGPHELPVLYLVVGIRQSQSVYAFFCWWTFRLLTCPDYCKYCYSEQWDAHIFWKLWFSLGICPRVGLL